MACVCSYWVIRFDDQFFWFMTGALLDLYDILRSCSDTQEFVIAMYASTRSERSYGWAFYRVCVGSLFVDSAYRCGCNSIFLEKRLLARIGSPLAATAATVRSRTTRAARRRLIRGSLFLLFTLFSFFAPRVSFFR